jgi:hypothetical protein
MRKLGLAVAAAIASLVLAAPAFAQTTVDVSARFVEGVPQQFGCTAPGEFFTLCGTGTVVPYGRATETIQFGAGCGGTCDLRTIYLAQGTLVLDETFSSPSCPGACKSHGLGQSSGTLTDVIISGTGIFEGATGTLTGTVQGAGASTKITLSGAITLTG